MSDRLRVLASAYACEPDLGSEAGIGWNWARQIARRHDCWLITRANNVAAIEARAAAEGLDSLRVVGFDLPSWMRCWKRKSRGAVAYFYLWQRALASVARRLEREVGFDVLHHLTFASSWIPSGLAELERPFVWGPVGQHPRIPDRFLPRAAVRARAAEWAKTAVRGGLSAGDPAVRRTLERADRILSLSRVFGDRVARRHRCKLEPMLAAGVEPRPLPPDRFERDEALRVLYAGRLVDLKGVRLALEAFALLARRSPAATFELCGSGPLAASLAARARALGLERRVRLLGHLAHDQTLARMEEADVFLFPSFEGAGMVVPEAMAAGCPVVCLDFGGPGEMTGTERGLRVPLEDTPAATARGLGEALVRLDEDEGERRALAHGARAWALAVAAWDAKGERLAGIYARAIEHHDGRRGERREGHRHDGRDGQRDGQEHETASGRAREVA